MFIGNRAFLGLAPEGHHPDRPEQHPQLPQDQQPLRSGSRRVRPRPDSPLVPQERLRRRADRLGGRRVRSLEAGLRAHLHHRGRREVPLSVRSTSSRTSATSTSACCAAACVASIRVRPTTPKRSKSRSKTLTIEMSKRGYAFAQVRPRWRPQLTKPARSRSCSWSRRARGAMSSRSTCAATRVRATI